MAAVAARDDDGDDDGIPGRAVVEDKPLPRCRTRPTRTFAVGDDDDDGAADAAVAAGVAVALVQCPQTPATHPRPPVEGPRALAPRCRVAPRTNCPHHCCAAGARIPRADSRARNCCARLCVHGASRVPASFQVPVPLSPVAVDRRVSAHVI